MICRDSLLWRDVAEYSILQVVVAAHSLVSFFFLHSDEFFLYKVAGREGFFNKLLDRFAANYACFDEDPTFETFFIYNKSSDIREGLAAGGKFLKMPRDMR